MLIEVSLVWIVIVAVVARTSFRNSTILLGVGLMAALYWFFFIHRKNRAIEKPLEREFAMDDVFDPFAGGYPIPPRPGQTLPEFASVVTGAEPQVDTDTSDTTTEGKEF